MFFKVLFDNDFEELFDGNLLVSTDDLDLGVQLGCNLEAYGTKFLIGQIAGICHSYS